MSAKKEKIEVPRVTSKPNQKVRFSATSKPIIDSQKVRLSATSKPIIESQKVRLSATSKPIIDTEKARLSAKKKPIKESSYHRTSVGPKFIKKRDLNSKFDSIYESSFIRNKNLSKTRESSKNDNKLNQTTIIEPKNLKLEKKEIKVKTGIKKNLPINNNNNIKSTSQLKTSLIELKKELKE
jgi:hypothetical protein